MIEALRKEEPVRGNTRKTLARKSFVPEELRIIHRPEQIETRQWPGHWEGNRIKGTFNRSCVGALVEPKTRSWCCVAWTATRPRTRWKGSRAR